MKLSAREYSAIETDSFNVGDDVVLVINGKKGPEMCYVKIEQEWDYLPHAGYDVKDRKGQTFFIASLLIGSVLFVSEIDAAHEIERRLQKTNVSC